MKTATQTTNPAATIREQVRAMRPDACGSQPIAYEFGADNWAPESGDGWETPEPVPGDDWSAERCRRLLEGKGAEFDEPDADGEPDPSDYAGGEEFEEAREEWAEEWRDAVRGADWGDAFAPMMSHYYPLPGDWGPLADSGEEAQTILAESGASAVAAVEVDGRAALALTGGGTDLSWNICRAFIALGFLPPAHFCDLPRLAGWQAYEDAPLVLAACEASCRVVAGWLEFRRERVAAMLGEIETV